MVTAAFTHGVYRRRFGFGWGYSCYGYGGYWPYYGDAGVCYAVRQTRQDPLGLGGIRRVLICE